MTSNTKTPEGRLSAEEQVALIGTTGKLKSKDGFNVPVKIHNARLAFHRTDVEVEPVGGSGKVWADLHRITLDKPLKVASAAAKKPPAEDKGSTPAAA